MLPSPLVILQQQLEGRELRPRSAPMLLDGFTHIIDEQEMRDLLLTKTHLRVKAGFDPTSPDLHLGHAVLLKKLRQFQDAGHTVVMIVGDATAAIGDPTGRNKLRPPLTADQINHNAFTYMSQAFRILDRDRTVIRRNSSWFDEMGMKGVIELLSSFTLSQVTCRDEFKDRINAHTPIFMHEMVYPLMQAYDSYREGVDIELGGNDQFFNLMMGRDYMRLRGEKPQVVATVPLLLGTDGKQKMSKSLGNHIALTEEPFEMFSKVMSISDDLMRNWQDILFPETKIPSHMSIVIGPMQTKLMLGFQIVSWLHDEKSAHEAREQWMKTFPGKTRPDKVRNVSIPTDDVANRIDRVLATAGISSSIADGQRLIRSGAVYVDGLQTKDNHMKIRDAELRVGRQWITVNRP